MNIVNCGCDQTLRRETDCSSPPQSASASNYFPNETWNIIFQSLDRADLIHVARVSHHWNALAGRLLYICVPIFEAVSQVPRKTKNCCDGLLRRPYLAELVRNFQVRWIVNLNFVTPWIDCESGLRGLSNTLRILTSLECLDLCLNMPGYSTYHSWDLLSRCRFPFLRQLALSGIGYVPLTSFLNNTPSISHLALVGYHQTLTLDPCALPSLCSFRGSPETATLVVPGRPVERIELVGQGIEQYDWVGIPRDDISQLALTSIPVRYLDLSRIIVSPKLLGDISNHLSCLKILKVKFSLRYTLHHSGIVSTCPHFRATLYETLILPVCVGHSGRSYPHIACVSSTFRARFLFDKCGHNWSEQRSL